MKFIFLAAGRGTRIFKDIKINKCLIKIKKKTIISKLIEQISPSKRNQISIVVGFNSKKIVKETENYKINYILNKNYKKTEMLYSALLALKKYDDDLFFSYTDILYDKKLINFFSENKFKDITIPINLDWLKTWKLRKQNIKEDAETLRYRNNKLLEIGNKIKKIKDVQGQFMGVFYIPRNKRIKIINLIKQKKYKKKQITYFLNDILKKGEKINVHKYKGMWYEFDNYEDLRQFNREFN